MKKKDRENRPGFAKLLDAWVPPEDAGAPIGCMATSFTFDADFFENECLSRFLSLETDLRETPTANLIEREEKLSQVKCAAALVDQHHSRGLRNLRWDLLSARQRQGILHAKVSLLRWSHRVRLIVASANLTEPGYRHNHEVFAALDYHEESSSPLSVLDELIAFLRATVSQTVSDDATSPAVKRWNAFLDETRDVARDWGITTAARGTNQPRVFAVLTGPGRVGTFEQLIANRTDDSPLHRALVISPFFDDADATNEPARQIWNMLKQRGEAIVEYEVTAELESDGKRLILAIPDLELAQPPNRPQFKTQFSRLLLDETRPLHAKCLCFDNDRTILEMIGSSNFTSKGLGLGSVRNIEANLCFEVNRDRQKKVEAALDAAWLDSEEIPKDVKRCFQRRADGEDDESTSEIELLPPAFTDAIYSHDRQHGWLDLVIRREPEAPPNGWMLFVELSAEPFVCEAQWEAAGQPTTWRVPWERDRPPSGFDVSWPTSNGRAWWPVTIQNHLSLPPPVELKNLPLELLIEVLTSARPLHQVLGKYLERQTESGEIEVSAELDPHRRVDTSGFLLQRTRRVSWALTALRERLERPVASKQALDWRLRGPVGVFAIARAITDDVKNPTERSFFLAELCLELHRVQPRTEDAKSLPVKAVRAAMREVIDELQKAVPPETLGTAAGPENAALAKYVQSVFAKVKT